MALDICIIVLEIAYLFFVVISLDNREYRFLLSIISVIVASLFLIDGDKINTVIWASIFILNKILNKE